MSSVVVIGGGAAGMMAALTAAAQGADVTLLEKNEKLGKKLYITGKGRCNVTNDCTLDEFLHEVARNPRFLYSALTAFTPQDMISLLETHGCPVTVQRGRRVFPQSEKASDVTRTLTALLTQGGVDIRLNAAVSALCLQDQQAVGVRLQDGSTISSDAVIVATGGLSYPMTGSTGDGYRFAQAAGHTVVACRPSLSAMESSEEWPRTLQGLSLKNVRLSLICDGKTCYSETGEMLFTHFGLSGPLTLEASCHWPERAAQAEIRLDLKPGLNAEQLDARLIRELQAQPRKQLRHIMPALLPGKLAALLPELAGVSGETICAQLGKAERGMLVDALKALRIPVSGLRPVSEAIVTRGGVSTRELNPATMASKIIRNLYFAGEVIDVDAHTGGYNLQIAFATGRAAGLSAALAAAGA